MSDRLKEMIDNYFAKVGVNASVKLSLDASCAQRTIYKVKNEGHIPRPAAAYRLAKACGWTEGDALKLSHEVAAMRAKRTA